MLSPWCPICKGTCKLIGEDGIPQTPAGIHHARDEWLETASRLKKELDQATKLLEKANAWIPIGVGSTLKEEIQAFLKKA